jgi:exopolysaccharide production protein ExoZ
MMQVIFNTVPTAARRIDGIEALRALAANSVVVGHILDDVPQFGVKSLAPLADLPVWQSGVDLFFVISGLVMVWSFGDRFGQPDAAREFLARRVARIVPFYWLATLATAAVLAAAPWVFERVKLEWWHLLLSMLFIPHYGPGGELSPVLGVGWTLNYEMFFYAIFAFGLAFPIQFGLMAISVTMVSLFALASWLEPSGHALVMFLADSISLEFLFGIGIGLLIRRFGINRAVLLGTAALALAAALLAPSLADATRAVKAGLPACAIVCVTLATFSLPAGLLGRWTLALGAASYALYLAHPLVLNLTKGAVMAIVASHNLDPTIAFALYAATAFAAAGAAGLLLRRYCELPVLYLVRAALLRPASVGFAPGARETAGRADAREGLISIRCVGGRSNDAT